MTAISEQTFFLDPDFAGTLQQQLQHNVASGIVTGRFRPGDRLPSTRRLADHLGISRITVTLAYTELLANDYLCARGRSGYFVSDTAPRPPDFAARARTAGDAVDWSRAIGQRFSGGADLDRPTDWARFPYPFIYGQTDTRLFDHRNWRTCALQALGQRDFAALTADQYDRDDPALVDAIARTILPRRGIAAGANDILVTLGAQNGLWIAAQVLLTQRRRAAMENPGYPGLRDILAQTRCKTRAVDVDENGLPPEALSGDEDVVFVTPSHHCPTGATMPLARRRALLDRAGRDNFLIVEDDYEFEIAANDKPAPALKSLDGEGRVIYLGSLSKSVFPGLRLGYLVGAPAFIREARALRALTLRHPPGHLQRTAAYFLSLGHYDAQVRRLTRVLGERRAVLRAALARHGLGPSQGDARGGSSLWMRAPDGVDTAALARRLRDRGVLIEPGRVFFGRDTPDRRHYRLAYSSIPADRIDEGVARIADAMRPG